MDFRRHSGHLESFRVLLKHLHYYPGDTLRGIIEIIVNDPIKYSLLEAVITSEEKTRFGTTIGWRFDSETRVTKYYKRRVIVAGNPPPGEALIYSERNSSENWSDADGSTVDTGEGGSSMVTVGLMPGTYTFPFSVVLPDILPPSYEDHRGSGFSKLTYCLKTKLYSGSRVRGKDRTYFTLRMLPVNPLQWIAVHRKVDPRVRSSSIELLACEESMSLREGKEESENNDDENNDENQVSSGSKSYLIDHQFSLYNEAEINDTAENEEDNINEDDASQTPFPNSYGVAAHESENKEKKKKEKEKKKDDKKERKREKEERKKREKMEKKKNKNSKGMEQWEDSANLTAEHNGGGNNGNNVKVDNNEDDEFTNGDIHSNQSEGRIDEMSNENASQENGENIPPDGEDFQTREERLFREQQEEERRQREQELQGQQDDNMDELIYVDPAYSDGEMWAYKLDVPIVSIFKRGIVSVSLAIHSIICVRGQPVTFRAVIDNSRGLSSITKVVFLLVNRVRMSSKAESCEYRTVLREKVMRDHACREHRFGIPESQLVLPNNTPLTLITKGYACRTFLEVKISCVYGFRTQTGTARAEIAVVDGFDIQGKSRRVKKWTNFYRGREMTKESQPYPDVISPFVTNGEMVVVSDDLERLNASLPRTSISRFSVDNDKKDSSQVTAEAPKRQPLFDYDHVVYRPRSTPGAAGSSINPFRRSGWDTRVDLED
ncbi:uncharacterized protein TM35_000063670 [Trypanosoma theileri]|uniref:Arrestin-like N-terminal domain-containing protein n=1 Tax=Trypanosoma theileri TaxID=67003 RepID=A0A1X0P376_9TRYP|nr:uncharacterized protein TM35_000063670 [Trypanosoma theileri]ORC91362.1 hypothetical protein TM35_000063670 [Trypanosoma theileri]